tara:strand:+ start:163 stop:846 length:684 start_codon:yes stop_codon:yes gene_type:complete
MYGSTYNPLNSPGVDVPFEQPKSLFRFGEISIWSSFMFTGATNPASSVNRLFSVARGSSGQGFTNALSIAETSLKEAGRVPSGVAYDVYGVACQIEKCASGGDTTVGVPIDTAAEITDLLNIQSNGVLSWDFTQTNIEICPVSLAGAGGGAFGAVALDGGGAAAQSGHLNNGNGQVWMYRKHPVALPGNTTFAINLSFGSRASAFASDNVVVRVVLLGYYKNIIEIG